MVHPRTSAIITELFLRFLFRRCFTFTTSARDKTAASALCVVSTAAHEAAAPFSRSRKKSARVFLDRRSRTLRISCVRRSRSRSSASRRTNSIYFLDIGVGSSRRNGWTDKWMYVVRSFLSLSLERERASERAESRERESVRGCVKDSRLSSPRWSD